MKSRYIKSCLWCGIRAGQVRSAFCYVDAKRLGVKLASMKHRTHWFNWHRHVEGWFGKSIVDILKLDVAPGEK